jgi:archaemetzincin
LLPVLRDYAQAFFQLPARVAEPLQLSVMGSQTRGSGAADHVGGQQYLANSIIDHVLSPRLPPDAVAYFGVTGADLYAPKMNFVFGQGNFTRRVGVYSLGRYFPAFWNQKRSPADDRLALRRACQVLNHEIGHMFGLPHCVFYHCAMNGSNSLAEADATPIEYCHICHRKLLWTLAL